MRTILYLHGFRSSPASFKARVMARHLAQRGVFIDAATRAALQMPEAKTNTRTEGAVPGTGEPTPGTADPAPPAAKQSLSAAEDRMRAQARFLCPALPISPAQAMTQLLRDAPLGPEDAVIGSSLGGFYATWLAERSGCRCVLLNPAIEPARGLSAHIGATTYFHSDQPFEFKPHYLDELQAWQVAQVTHPQRYFLLAAKGDALIDWRDMVARYQGAAMKVLEGSDHAISDFEDHVAQVADIVLAGLPHGV